MQKVGEGGRERERGFLDEVCEVSFISPLGQKMPFWAVRFAVRPFFRLINLANIKEIPVEKERGRESGAIISGNDRRRPHNFSGDLEKSPIIPIYFRFVPNGFLGALQFNFEIGEIAERAEVENLAVCEWRAI